MIRVLIVDDSPVQRELLQQILTSDPEIEVVGMACDGEEGVREALAKKPDIITMDIHMPNMDGIEATRKIMSLYPVPIVVISASSSEMEVASSFEALEAGAIAIAEKLNFVSGNTQKLVETVKLMSEIKMVRRVTHLKNEKIEKKSIPQIQSLEIRVIAVGVSTGGPPVLQEIFKNLPTNFPPILVVQHITPGFLKGLSDWLAQTTQKTIKIATQGEKPEANQIYFAPEDYHMGLDVLSKIVLTKDQPENGHRPSASFLFRSCAKNFGNKTLGILLTGMGHDGAEGLKLMKESGAFTIAQNKETSIIFGMPAEAIALKAVSKILSPLEISDFIAKQVRFCE